MTDLYEHAGCSTPQIELLTGQSRTVVGQRMRDWGIPLRDAHHSPALMRLRAVARERFLADVAARFDRTGSTVAVAAELGCAPDTVRRWLMAADRAVPGRGRWPRRRR